MYWDLHLHLVPGVDDGAMDLEESRRMARALVAAGYAGGAVSPHIRPGLFDNRAEDLRPRIEALATALRAAEIPFEVFAGAEHFLVPGLLDGGDEGAFLPLGRSERYLLLEVPTVQPVVGLPDFVFRARLKGITPVFAHPERCATFDDLGLVRRLVDGGAVLQLDLGSLAGHYGRGPKKAARRLLDAGLYGVAGSDLHDAETAERALPKWIATLEKRAGLRDAARLLSENPQRLLAGEEVLP